MGRAASIERTIERTVALRRVAEAVVEPRERQRLSRVERELRREIGVSVPKTRAAALLGVSVNALERWIAAEGLPTVRRPGSSLRFFPLLKVLCDRGVEFVVIGGFAVVLHGVVRATKDVNIVPEQSEDNLTRLWEALGELEAEPKELIDLRPEEMAIPFTRDGLIQGGGNWVLLTRLGRIDVMQWVTGVESYEDLRARAAGEVVPEIGGTVWFAGFDDLIAMKQAAGRPQDLIDITALRMAHGLEE